MKNNRKLSVIIPNFNHGAVLERAVASHLCQTHTPTEILIVDDCSLDDSVAIAEAICKENSVIRLIQRKERGGPNAAIASGLEQSHGDYICFAAADDFVDPSFAANAIISLEQHPQAAFCFFDPSAFHEDSRHYVNIPLALASKPVHFKPAEFKTLLANNYFTISSNTVLYRRSAILAVNGFPTALEWQADWFTNLVLAFRHGVCYRPESPAHFVVNSKGYGSAGVRSAKGQRRLLYACLDALEGEYSDVAPHFRAAGLVPEMRLRTLFWLLNDARGRRFLTPHLFARLINREIWSILRPLIPVSVRVWMRHRAINANSNQ